MTKLEMLLEAEGYASVEQLRTAKPPACSLGICTNLACFDTREMATGPDGAWCAECNTKSVKSALALAEII